MGEPAKEAVPYSQIIFRAGLKANGELSHGTEAKLRKSNSWGLLLEESERVALLVSAAEQVRQLAEEPADTLRSGLGCAPAASCAGDAAQASSVSESCLPTSLPLVDYSSRVHQHEKQMTVVDRQMHLERSWTTAAQDFTSFLATTAPRVCSAVGRASSVSDNKRGECVARQCRCSVGIFVRSRL